jgi:hypothetical protein
MTDEECAALSLVTQWRSGVLNAGEMMTLDLDSVRFRARELGLPNSFVNQYIAWAERSRGGLHKTQWETFVDVPWKATRIGRDLAHVLMDRKPGPSISLSPAEQAELERSRRDTGKQD